MKMRKSFLALLLLLAACLALACPARAQTLTLPSSLKTIADEAFWHNTSITSAVVPDGAERIGARAFAGCTGLTEITLPATVTSIADDAFDGCTGLTILCYEDCYATRYAQELGISYRIIEEPIPEGLHYKIYSTYAVITEYTGTATHLNVPKTIGNVPVTRITFYAFDDCRTLVSIHLPDSIEAIGAGAFDGCTNLTEINYPMSLTTITDGNVSPFYECPKLVNITIPEGVTSIPDYCFNLCSSLRSVYLPESLRSIGIEAFSCCDALESVHLPDGIETLDNEAFSYCDNLAEINYPLNLTNQGRRLSNSPFEGCPKLQRIIIPEGVTSIPGCMFKRCESLKTVSLPDSLCAIGDDAFSYCNGLQSVLLPDGIKNLGIGTFTGCENLSSINYPMSVEECWRPFDKCPKLESIIIPEGVVSIPKFMFYGCESLKSISLPESLRSIGASAFSRCNGLQSVHLPDGLEILKDDAFAGCESLSSINYPRSLYKWQGTDIFKDCPKLTSMIIPEGVETISSGIFFGCSSWTDIYIPSSIDWIGGIIVDEECIPNLTIYGVSGSYAETFAAQYGIAFSEERMPGMDFGDCDSALSFTVLSPEGTPIAGASIEVCIPSTGAVLYSLNTDREGHASVDSLQQRSYLIRCSQTVFAFDDLYFSPYGTTASITIKAKTSDDAYLVPSASCYIAAQAGGSVSIPISASQAWTAACPDSWLTLAVQSGQPGDALAVSITANEGAFRSGCVSLTAGDEAMQVYIHQPGLLSSRLEDPVITYPAANGDSIPYGDIVVTWEPVEGAERYVLSLRDTDTDTLLLSHATMDNQTQATLSTDYFADGHSYRVAVGAVPPGADSSDSVVSWRERTFTVEPYVSNEAIEFSGVVYEMFDPVLVANAQAYVSAYGMEGAASRITSEAEQSSIEFRGAYDTTVSMYHLVTENNESAWVFERQTQSDEEGRYSFRDGLVNGDTYGFVFTMNGYSFIWGTIEETKYIAAPGNTQIIDVYCYDNKLSEQINAFLSIQKFDTAGMNRGLFAEYFAFSDKNKAFTIENKRYEAEVKNIDFSWSGEEFSSGLFNNRRSYNVLQEYPFGANFKTASTPDTRYYVPFKFAARFSGFIMLKGSEDANTLSRYKFRLRGDDGMRISMKLPNYQSFGDISKWHTNQYVIDMSKNGFLNGTVLQLCIEYYNKSSGGKANLIFEYTVDNGKTWKTVPDSWFYHIKDRRTVSISGSEHGVAVDYATKMAQANDKLRNYGDQLVMRMLGDLASMSVSNGIAAYNKNSVMFDEAKPTDGEVFARFWEQRLGKKAAKAVYMSLFGQVCNINSEETIWAEIRSRLKSEYSVSFDTVYDSTTTTIDGIATLMELSSALNDNVSSNASITALQSSIMTNIERYTIGDLKDLDSSGSTADAGYSALFELSGKSRETVQAEILRLNSDVNTIWKTVNKGRQLLNSLWGTEDADKNRASLWLMFAEQGKEPDLFKAGLQIAIYDDKVVWKELDKKNDGTVYETPSKYATYLNSISNSSINRMTAIMNDSNLDVLLYKDLLKFTLDTAYSYYKGLL